MIKYDSNVVYLKKDPETSYKDRLSDLFNLGTGNQLSMTNKENSDI